MKINRTTGGKLALIAGLSAAALLSLSACSSIDAVFSSSAPQLENTTVGGVEYGPTLEGMPTLPDTWSDSVGGEWRKTTILPDDPAFTFSSTIVTDAARANWSEDEIAAAQRAAVEMAVEMIDTPSNGAPNDTDGKNAWWGSVKDRIAPEAQSGLYEALMSEDPDLAVAFKGAHRDPGNELEGYGLMYGENQVHVRDRNIITTAIDHVEVDGYRKITVGLDLNYNNVVNVDGQPENEYVIANIEYGLIKSESGGLLIGSIAPYFKYAKY